MAELVSRPTRITDHSATLIDHAYTNSIDNTLSCNIVTLDISDHLAIHLKTIITKSIPLNERISRSKLEKGPDKGRVFNDANHAAFYNLIDSETWDDIDPYLSAQEQYDKFDVTCSKHYNSAFPEKKTGVKTNGLTQNPGFYLGSKKHARVSKNFIKNLIFDT